MLEHQFEFGKGVFDGRKFDCWWCIEFKWVMCACMCNRRCESSSVFEECVLQWCVYACVMCTYTLGTAGFCQAAYGLTCLYFVPLFLMFRCCCDVGMRWVYAVCVCVKSRHCVREFTVCCVFGYYWQLWFLYNDSLMNQIDYDVYCCSSVYYLVLC